MTRILLLLLTNVFFLAPLTAKDKYPDSWWAYIDPSGAPSWEVFPQEASREKGEVILSKRLKDLGLLSNFAANDILYQGKTYKSIEGFWQMLKYPEGANDIRSQDHSIKWPHTRQEVGQMTGFDAKDAGNVASENMKKLGINWVTFNNKKLPYKVPEKGEHYRLIYDLTKAKVLQNADVQEVLIKTGDLKLLPDHDQGNNPPPAWRYYEILMAIRDELTRK